MGKRREACKEKTGRQLSEREEGDPSVMRHSQRHARPGRTLPQSFPTLQRCAVLDWPCARRGRGCQRHLR
eukprot:12397-Eustigmatos_ZCMA.PRE.1